MFFSKSALGERYWAWGLNSGVCLAEKWWIMSEEEVTEPGQNDLLALAVLWGLEMSMHKAKILEPQMDGSEEYVWVHMETSSIYAKHSEWSLQSYFSQASIFFLIPKTIMAHGNQFTEVKLSSKLYSSDK